jgi:hypothetical protein
MLRTASYDAQNRMKSETTSAGTSTTYSYNPLRFIDPTGKILQCVGNDDQQKQCFADLQQIVGDASRRLLIDAKTGVVSFDTKDLDLSKNAGGALVNDLVGSKNTFDFSIGPTIMTDKGPVRIDTISGNLANLPHLVTNPKLGAPARPVSPRPNSSRA